MTPIQAIRKYCLDCSNGQASEVKHCGLTYCPLYPFRMGKNPNAKGKMNKVSTSRAETENLQLTGGFSEKKGI